MAGRRGRGRVGGIVLILIVLAATAGPIGWAVSTLLFGAATHPTSSAFLSTVQTRVDVQPVQEKEFAEARQDQILIGGDTVRTAATGRGIVTFIDESSVVLEPGSQLTILPPARVDGGLINRFSQSFGSSWTQFAAIAQGGTRHEIQTAAGVVSIRDGGALRIGIGRGADGTEIVSVVVLDGSADFSRGVESKLIATGQMLTAAAGEPLPEPVEAPLPNEVQIVLKSSTASLLVTQLGTGLSTGTVGPTGHLQQITLSLSSLPGTELQTIRLIEPAAGTYAINLLPTTAGGPFEVEAVGYAGDAGVFAYVSRGDASGCQWLTLTLDIQVDGGGKLTGGALSPPFGSVSTPAVAGGTSLAGPCPPAESLRAEVGGVKDTPTPTPRPTRTASPTRTPSPTRTATVAAPTATAPPQPSPTPALPSIDIEPGQQSLGAGDGTEFAVLSLFGAGWWLAKGRKRGW